MKTRKITTSLLLLTLILANGLTAQAKTIDVPAEVVEISEELGGKYRICPELIQAICFKESSFRPDVENGGCVGIMQIYPKWHNDRMDRLGVTDLADIRQNMTVGVDYLAELSEGGTDIAEVLMKYHGESDIEGKLSDGELSEYAEIVLEISAELERENGK